MNMTRLKVSLLGIAFILIMTALIMVPAAAHGGPHYTCGPHDYGTCPAGQECQCHEDQVCGWGDWHNGKCPGGHETETCNQVFSFGWHHRHYECHTEQDCGCAQLECTNGMNFRVSIPSSPDPTPYNIGTAPATVDFWSNPYPNIEDPFPEGTTFLWDFGDGEISTDGPTAVYHTYTTPGVYDVTLTVTFLDGCPLVVSETKEDYLMVTASDEQAGTRSPFSSSEWSMSGSSCRAFFNDPDTTTGKALLAGRTYYVVMLYNSEIDGGQVCTYNELESLFYPDCSQREYYNNEPVGERQYGGGRLVFSVQNPSQKIGVLMVRGTGLGLPMTMQIEDAQSGAVMDEITTMGDKIQIAYPLIDDLSTCRPQYAEVI